MSRPLSILRVGVTATLAWVLTLAHWEALTAAATDAGLAGRKPNVVLILTDDQGYGDFGCHGNPVLRTPHLDRLHAESRRFTDFLVSPTCAPTRCALLTGRHEFRSGVTHTIYERERMSLKARTLAQVLQSAGYTTGLFGKWHLGDERAYWPDRRGFDAFTIHGGGGIGQTYPGSCGDAPGNRYFNPVLLHNGRFVKTQGYCADLFFAQAMTWMAQRPPGQPFFAAITPNTPHEPLDCPPDYEARYTNRVDRKVARFFGMIANLDDNVGRLLDHLARSELERNTLVIYMNDNGGTAGVKLHNAGMRGAKGSPWYGGIRAASFWRWPGLIAPGDTDRLAAHVDVLPTLAELAGAPLPTAESAALDGRSLVPLLADPHAPWDDRLLFTHVGRWERGRATASRYRYCSVRTAQYQLVNVRPDGPPQWELYDLRADPAQAHNLAAQQTDRVQALASAYDRWWDSILPGLENESAVGPAENPFKVLFREQFGGGTTP